MPSSAQNYDFAKLSRKAQNSPLYHGIAPEKVQVQYFTPRIKAEGIAYVLKPSTTSESVCKTTKCIWVPDGEDREGAFVFSLRAFYKSLPETTKPKQLAGLYGYGVRCYDYDAETGQPLEKIIAQEGLPTKRRYAISQNTYTGGFSRSLSRSDSPRDLCICIRDSIIGLMNAYRLGYVHREITIDSVRKTGPQLGYILSEDGSRIAGEAIEYIGLVKDFAHCTRHAIKEVLTPRDKQYKIIRRSAPTYLLTNKGDMVPTAVHDLESMLWILIHYIIDIVQHFTSGKKSFEDECPELEDPADLPKLIQEMPFPIARKLKEVEAILQRTAQADNEDDDAKSDITIRGGAKPQSTAEQVTASEDGDAMSVDEDHPPPLTDEPTEIKQEPPSEEAASRVGSDLSTSSEERADHKRKPSKHIEKEEGLKRYKSDEVSDKINEAEVEMEDTATTKSSASATKSSTKATVYEPVTNTLRQLLNPPKDVRTHVANREMLFEKLDKIIENSVCLAPFNPLLCALRSLAAEYYAKSVQMHQQDTGVTFSPTEVEEAFARYLGAFQMYTPSEEDWSYMRRYIKSLPK